MENTTNAPSNKSGIGSLAKFVVYLGKIKDCSQGNDWLNETGNKFLYTLVSALLDADAFQTPAKRYFIWRI